VWRMQPLFFARAQLHGSEVAARTMAELLSVAAVTGLKPGVAALVQKLDAMCAGEKPPPVAIIRHPRVRHFPLWYCVSSNMRCAVPAWPQFGICVRSQSGGGGRKQSGRRWNRVRGQKEGRGNKYSYQVHVKLGPESSFTCMQSAYVTASSLRWVGHRFVRC